MLIHGFLGNSSDMAEIETRLQAEGYKTVNPTYNTTSKTIDQMANEIVHSAILSLGNVDKLHIVTHSMGGILFRAYSEDHDVSMVDRVVMLAPPNHGSEVAAELSQYSAYREFFGPAGTELANIKLSPSKVGNYELGIIAGSSSVNPILSPILPGRDDGWVSLSSTLLVGMNDYIVVPTSHGFITKNESAIDETVYFLKHGEFDHTMPIRGVPITTDDIINFYGTNILPLTSGN